MIVQEEGRWRSYVTPDESQAEIDDLVSKMSSEELAALEALLEEVGHSGSSRIADTCAELEWDEVPLPIEEWLESYEHIGDLKDSIYPVLKQDIIELFNGNYHEVVLTGCIDKQALVQCSDGSMPTLGSLIGRKTRVLTVHETRGVSHYATTEGVDSGVKKVLDLTLRNGMRVKLTPDHRVLTQRGWVRADQLNADADYVLRPRQVTYRPSNYSLRDEEVKLLAYMVTDGSSSDTRARYCDGRRETAQEFVESLRALGFDATTNAPYVKGNAWEVRVKRLAASGFRDWLKQMGVFKMGCSDAEVPDAVCRAPLKQVALFLNRVWAAEGTVAYKETSPPRFQLAMTSERFIQQVQLLLLRWGIQSRVREYTSKRKGTVTTGYCLHVSGKKNIELFIGHIGVVFSKEQEVQRIIDRVSSTIGNTNVDVVPLTWGEANDYLINNSIQRGAGNKWWSLGTQRPRRLSRKKFDAFCEDFGDEQAVVALKRRYPKTVAYERIKSIVALDRPIPVADIGVPGPTRFTANGLSVHNSTRWGKDFFSTTCMVRLLYELCCLRDPAQSMGLGAGESIHVVPISRTTAQARRIVFGGIASKLNLAPWWRGRFKETLDYIEFPEKKITIVGGASSDASALGLNVYTALVDEGNFMGVVKASEAAKSAGGKTHDRAQMICDALVRRIQGTYRHSGVKGMLFLISSKRATDDFTERRIREHIKQGTTNGVFVRDYATWHVRPGPYENQNWYRCSVSAAEGRCRILEEDETPPEDAIVFTFPEDFKSEFERDPAGATRDIAGIATDTYAPFIANRPAIESMFDEHRPQVFAKREWDMATGTLDINWEDTITLNARGEKVPVCCSAASRHVHIDLSKNMCATGFNLCHQAGSIEVVRTDAMGQKSIEEAPVFHIDGMLRIIAGNANEIDHSDVRALIYRLNEGGFNIRSVSMDHWMSVPNMQLLKKHGFKVEELSTVKKIDPFDCARSALYEGRIQAPPHAQLGDELRSLELDPKRPHDRPKVIVQPGHTKDLADAWAGGIYYLSINAKGGVLLAPSLGASEAPSNKSHQWGRDGEILFADEEGYENWDSGNEKRSDDPWAQAWFV